MFLFYSDPKTNKEIPWAGKKQPKIQQGALKEGTKPATHADDDSESDEEPLLLCVVIHVP